MRHLVKRYSNFKSKVLAQFKTDKKSFDITEKDGSYSLLVNGYNIADLNNFKEALEGSSRLVSDIIANDTNSGSIEAFIDNGFESLGSIVDYLKDKGGVSLHISDMYKDTPDLLNLEDTLDPCKIKKKLESFASDLHDVNETLKVCYEDASTITSGKLIGSMCGAKPMQKILTDLNNEIVDNSDWERVEFFISIINKSIEQLVHKMNIGLNDGNNENQKIINTVIIPNIIDNYYKLKGVISGAVSALSNLIYIDNLFKKNTTYPASWFMNNSILTDLKLDYKNLIVFLLKVPMFERGIIHPLDIMKHNFMKKL